MVSSDALPPTLNSPELNCAVYASGVRSWKVMSSPFAWSSFLALITGGMKAPSDGALKITMEIFSSACAWHWVAAATATRAAAAREAYSSKVDFIVSST